MESQKTKRISWPFNLCQVRQFSSSDPPSKVGMGHLKAKSLGPAQSRGDAPPGFETIRPANLKLFKIPLTKWRCPPKFELSSEWQVGGGEESKERKAQNEAIYPPNSPWSTTEDLNTHTRVVPLTPIEEREAGPLIDYNLLAKLLSNPQMVKQLIAIQSAPNSSKSIALNPTPSRPDIKYYRSLIQQYGGGQREDNITPSCTERGNAADQSSFNSITEVQAVKRTKLN